MSDKKSNLTYADMLREARQPQKINFNPGEDYAPDKRYFQGIPSIECTQGGRLWAIWFAGGQGESSVNYVTLVTSGDGGGRLERTADGYRPSGTGSHVRPLYLAGPCRDVVGVLDAGAYLG